MYSRSLLVASLLLALAVRMRLAVTDDSIHWPDEITKTVEAGHRAAFGYGWKPWEYVYGAVSWAAGGVFAVVLRVLTAVGLDDPHRYAVVVRSLLVVASLSAAWAVYRAVKDWDGSDLAAAVAGAVAALAAPVVYFSHRPLTEVLSLAPVTFGVWLTLRSGERSRRSAVVGAALLGLAVLFRLQNGLVSAVVLVVLALRRDRERLRTVAVVLGIAAVVYGVIDWVTWGVPFHSAWEYWRWNVAKGVAGNFGTAPFHYYGRFLLLSVGPVAVVLGVFVLAAVRRASGLVAVPALFLLAHSLEAHKEARFVLVAVPLLCIAAGVGFDEVGRRLPRAGPSVLAAVVLVPVAFQAVTIERLTMRDTGQDHLFAASASAFAHSQEVNRLLFAAHRRADLCGIRVVPLEAEWTGGYTYLHRHVPFYDKRVPAERAAGHYNYEIVVRVPDDPRVVAADGGYGLLRVADACTPDPEFSTRLPDPSVSR